MGYYVNGGGDLMIRPENLPAALEALRGLATRTDLMGGHSYGTREDGTYGLIESYFAWMNDYDLAAAPSVEDVFTHLDFECVVADDGALHIVSFQNKTGDEEVFARAVEAYVEPGGQFIWRGEDGMAWCWLFDHETMSVLPL